MPFSQGKTNNLARFWRGLYFDKIIFAIIIFIYQCSLKGIKMNARLKGLSRKFSDAHWQNYQTKIELKKATDNLANYLRNIQDRKLIISGLVTEVTDFDNDDKIVDTSHWLEHYEEFIEQKVWISQVIVRKAIVSQENDQVLVDSYDIRLWLSKTNYRYGLAELYCMRWQDVKDIRFPASSTSNDPGIPILP